MEDYLVTKMDSDNKNQTLQFTHTRTHTLLYTPGGRKPTASCMASTHSSDCE